MLVRRAYREQYREASDPAFNSLYYFLFLDKRTGLKELKNELIWFQKDKKVS